MDQKREVLPAKQQLQVLKRLLGYLKPLKKSLIISLLLVVLATVFDLLGPIIIKYIADNFIQESSVDFNGLTLFLMFYAATNILYAIFKYVQIYKFNDMGYQVTKQLRDDLFEKLQSMGMRYFDQTPAGSIVSRVTNDTDAIQDMLNNVLSVVVSSLILIVGISVAMLLLNVQMALICMAFLPIAIGVMFLYQKLSTKFYLISREKLSQLNTRLAESISGMNIIQIFHQQRRIRKEFEVTNEEYYNAGMKNVKLEGFLLGPIINFITSLALVLLYAYSGFRAMEGLISVGLIYAFVEYVYRYFGPMFQIMDRLSIFQQSIVAAYRCFLILDHEELTPQQSVDANALIQDAKIEFKNVSFSYDGVHKVLHNISFVVNPGETIALVGHTGSGKSSIINVMMRFYEFYEGEILIDDVSIKEYSLEHLRSKMGLVLQDPFMYYGSIKDNIRLKDQSIGDHQIIEACKFVQADHFIEDLSDRYDHKVIERGASFSSGQKQLLAFARTIVKDPKILVLDEATANIDTETEALIQEGLERIRRGRTTIAIAHRLSTIKDANHILVLDQGNIVERGSHEELIEKKGIYYSMYLLQQSEASFHHNVLSMFLYSS